MKRTLVLGYGNPLRRDDGIGWHAAQALAGTAKQENLHILACHQLLPELAESISQFDRVIFVDASVKEPAGQISCRPIAARGETGNAMSHNMMPQTLLAWSRNLYNSEPEAVLVTMGAGSIEYGDGMTPQAAQNFAQLLDCVRAQIKRD
jgi:hydrogenase maturation protease